jgi:hypothetical protein
MQLTSRPWIDFLTSGESFLRRHPRSPREGWLTIDARIVIASVDTYLRFAEAVNRLDLTKNGTKLTELLEGS